jgi:hypothetical protein
VRVEEQLAGGDASAAAWVPRTPWAAVVLARLLPLLSSLLLDAAVWRAALASGKSSLGTLRACWVMLRAR